MLKLHLNFKLEIDPQITHAPTKVLELFAGLLFIYQLFEIRINEVTMWFILIINHLIQYPIY